MCIRDSIIRIGTAGGIADGVQLRDVVVGVGACTDSNYAAQFRLPGTFAPIADVYKRQPLPMDPRSTPI